jgi:hypothetical protein
VSGASVTGAVVSTVSPPQAANAQTSIISASASAKILVNFMIFPPENKEIILPFPNKHSYSLFSPSIYGNNISQNLFFVNSLYEKTLPFFESLFNLYKTSIEILCTLTIRKSRSPQSKDGFSLFILFRKF